MNRPRTFALLLATLALAAAYPASACIAEFRSTDWQVAESSLVILGKVIAVTPVPLAPEAAAIFRNGLPPPTTATVEIERIYQGACSQKRIQVSSGPLRSCSPFPAHTPFIKGQRCILILSEKTANLYPLTWGGSQLKAEDEPLVKESVARCASWRSDYLAQQSPATLAAAKKLDATLTTAAAKWPAPSQAEPTPASLLHGDSDDPAIKSAAEALLPSLQTLDSAVIEAALALDFASPSPWSRHPVWRQIQSRYTDSHPKEILALQHEEWSRLLKLAGATPEETTHYLDRISQDDSSPQLAFPIATPALVSRLRGENLTTDFLLRSQSFDRGDLYFTYGMDLPALAGLDPHRLTQTLPALCRSPDEHLKISGNVALAQMPTDDFCPLMTEQILADAQMIGYLQASPSADSHWKALLAYTQKNLTPEQKTKFWQALTAAECFSPPCVTQATTSATEPATPALRQSLSAYLKAANDYTKLSQSLYPPETK